MADSQEKLKAYEELCTCYRAIDDFRTKLLGFLPLATGAGIFLLTNNLTDEIKGFLGPIGAFGFVITLGLFSYEIYGIQKCVALIEAGEQIEGLLGIGGLGQFSKRPQNVARLINKPFAAGVIYPAVLAAWTYLAFVFVWPNAAGWSAVLVFLAGFVGTLIYDSRLRKVHAKNQGEHAKQSCSDHPEM